MIGDNLEDASGLPAHRTSDQEVKPAPAGPARTEVYHEQEGPISVPVVPAGPGTDDRTPTIPRKREHVWPEVHDPFDTSTADVDPRASGDPTGATREATN